jgi:V/A-type H+/Na+-transporting ATPase subunit E
MGYRELIDSLRCEGEEKLQAIRLTTETEIARLEAESAARIEALRDQYARRQDAAAAAEIKTLLTEADRQQALIRLEAKNVLAGRLYRAAQGSLTGLRNEGYPELFAALAAELLPCPWETVRVNPADAMQARLLFPGARIETDPGMAGGLEVAAYGGKLRIDNTLEKRLEREWPEILPQLMNAISKEA